MSFAIYTNQKPHATGHRRLTGTAHKGPRWISAARLLRSATQNTIEYADWRSSHSVDEIGTKLIDQLGELDQRCLHVLAFVLGVLVRESRKNR